MLSGEITLKNNHYYYCYSDEVSDHIGVCCPLNQLSKLHYVELFFVPIYIFCVYLYIITALSSSFYLNAFVCNACLFFA